MGHRLALLIGNSHYDDPAFSTLAKAKADARMMASVLGDQNIGGFEFSLLLNEEVETTRKKIASFFQQGKKDDFLLLYFSGHGDAWNKSGYLHLIMKDTKLPFSIDQVISSTFIKEAMDLCVSQTQVLILDCCNSGAFVQGIKGKPQVGEKTASLFKGSGHAVLTASSASQPAWEGNNATPLSLFTHYLVLGLRTGKADTYKRGFITLDEWYEYAENGVTNESSHQQKPSKTIEKQQGSIIIAKNPVALQQASQPAPTGSIQTFSPPPQYPSAQPGRAFRSTKSLLTSLALAVTVLILVAGTTAAWFLTHQPTQSWATVFNGNPGFGCALNGIAALTPDNIWAVGDYSGYSVPDKNPTVLGLTLIEHWDGSSWSVAPSPSPGSQQNYLWGITALASDNIWAVGDYQNTKGSFRTLTERWNGSSWAFVDSPNTGSGDNILWGITALASDNIWAIGQWQDDQLVPGSTTNYQVYQGALIEHWNGSSWIVVPSPNPDPVHDFYFLRSITALSSKNIWAVGYSQGTYKIQTLIEHWNGSSWALVASPNPGPAFDYLWGITALASDNIWAVGEYQNKKDYYQTLIEHWNGSSWALVASPNTGSGDNVLQNITTLSTTNIWAVGYSQKTRTGNGGPSQFTDGQTLIEHWDGSSWAVVPSPSPGSLRNELTSITALATDNIWTVGYYEYTSGYGQPLVEHWSNSS